MSMLKQALTLFSGKFLNTVIFSIGVTDLACVVTGCVDKATYGQEGEKQVTAKAIEESSKNTPKN